MTRRKVTPPIIGLITVFLFCCTLTGGQVFAKSDHSGDSAVLERSSKAFVNVVKKAKKAVVHIKVEKTEKRKYGGSQQMFNHPFFDQFFGPQFRQQMPKEQEYVQRGQGSGFIINKKGFSM